MKSLLDLFRRRWSWTWSKDHPPAAAQIARDCLLGLAAGLGAVLFQSLTDRVFNGTFGAYALSGTRVFLIGSFATIVTASLISGWLIAKVGPEAAGSGSPQVRDRVREGVGLVRW